MDKTVTEAEIEFKSMKEMMLEGSHLDIDNNWLVLLITPLESSDLPQTMSIHHLEYLGTTRKIPIDDVKKIPKAAIKKVTWG